jgi:hypothetical protein
LHFICIRLWGKSSCTLKCVMSLPWATFLHFGASFHDAPYILLQSDFIASTVVCDILNASSHCDILSRSLRTCCCSLIIVALHRTMGSLPLHYWHHLPWCFLDELVCCGQLRLVNSGTMEWSHLQTLWFICFWHSTLWLVISFVNVTGWQIYQTGHGWWPWLCCSDMHTCILETPLPRCVRASLCL